MSRIKCLIIDDEPHAAGILESYIGELDALEHVGTFYEAIDALMYLQRNKIDLLFLDVMLPKVTGDAFLKMLPCRPRVIYLSTRKKKWKPGDDGHIMGCLRKPVAFNDFMTVIDRYFAAIPPAMRRSIQRRRKRPVADRGPFIYLFSDKSIVKVFTQEVLYIEGVKHYSKITTTEGEIIIHQGLAAIEGQFAGKGFMRIHRALIVSVCKVTGVGESTIQIGTHILPVSRPYRGKIRQEIHTGLRSV
ncbi:two component transcriptional regulator, LytTR family [Dyadobacter soli]|uniref:Two component transcriptional regulator, LytTR family n=1 Tax=Dyadobacter soli TaxID=659014 RepID=A0A1G7LXV0_9BACT|nr:LytTR family DNA-binding domain-containing protein [Dyadobacter soli]SDF53769.1 two component transcriptional regulator, LytTR family [Dyadobacter soli]